MNDDIDAIFREQAAEDSHREAEQQQYEAVRQKWRVADAIQWQIEHPSTSCPSGSDVAVWFADLFVRYCRAVRDADPAADFPALTPTTRGAKLGASVVRCSWAGDFDGAANIFSRLQGGSQSLGRSAMGAAIDLLHRMRGTRGPVPGDWAEDALTDTVGSERAEGVGVATGEGDPAEGVEDREREILAALLQLDAVSERRRVLIRKAARKADPGAATSTYSHVIASLAHRGLVRSKRGPDGGVWLTPLGKNTAQSLQKKTPQ